MKTTVYSYRNKKVVLFNCDSFYLINNKKEYDKVVDNLMTIDAVTVPYDLTFPCVLKLKPGFTPTLVKSSLDEFKKQLSEEKKKNDLLDKQITSFENKGKNQ